MPKDQKKMEIVIMDNHFLYLPLFYAQSKDFFGHVPEGYSIEIITSPAHTDVAAYKMLMDTSSRKNTSVNFAIADPTTVLSHPATYDATPAILAAMISNTAFWAVDRNSHTVIKPQDLATFQNIIAFQPGTTSYSIAQRIFKDANKSPSIIQVNPNQELIALQKSTNTVALSPDILSIDKLIHEEEKFHIDLELATTQEFQNVFMTALISRQDVVDQHRSMIVGLLKALQLSLLLVRAQAPDLLKFAEQRFPLAKDRVESALNRASKAHVFPLSIEVSLVTWMNAAKLYYESIPAGFDHPNQENARLVFKHAVQPYLALSREAVSDLYSRFTEPAKTEPLWPKVLRLSLVVVLCLGVGIAIKQWSDWKAIMVFILGTVPAIAIEKWLKLERTSLHWFVHWFTCGLIQLVLIAWVSPEIKAHIPLVTILPPAAILTLLYAELRVVQEELKKAEKQGAK